MSIWFNKLLQVSDVNAFGENNMASHIGIEITEIGENFLKGRMPVDERTRQPYGLLHGGALATLAETLGSVASALVINPEKNICVGIEINANHIRGVKDRFVFGTATPLHLGSSTHVWDIRILDEFDKLVCVSRLTVAILAKK